MNPGLEARLSALIDGELEPGEEAALRAEAARDPELASRLRELERVDEALRALPGPAVPADARSRLRARIREEEAETRAAAAEESPVRARGPGASRAPARPGRRGWIAAGAALAVAAAILLLLLRPGPGPEDDRVPLAGSDGPPEAPAPLPVEPTEPSLAADDLEFPDLLDPLPGPEGIAAADPIDDPFTELSAGDFTELSAGDFTELSADDFTELDAGDFTELDADDPFAELAAEDDAPTPPEPDEALADPSPDDVVALASDLDPEELSVVEVLDWLAELDELEAESRRG